MDASAIRAARKRYAANVDSDVVRGYLLQALDGLEVAWEAGLNTGIGYASVMGRDGFPEPENPYSDGVE